MEEGHLVVEVNILDFLEEAEGRRFLEEEVHFLEKLHFQLMVFFRSISSGDL